MKLVWDTDIKYLSKAVGSCTWGPSPQGKIDDNEQGSLVKATVATLSIDLKRMIRLNWIKKIYVCPVKDTDLCGTQMVDHVINHHTFYFQHQVGYNWKGITHLMHNSLRFYFLKKVDLFNMLKCPHSKLFLENFFNSNWTLPSSKFESVR